MIESLRTEPQQSDNQAVSPFAFYIETHMSVAVSKISRFDWYFSVNS